MATLALATGAALATLAMSNSAKADDWACKVALCISNPAGPMAVSECVPPIKRLYRHLEHGGSFPLCHSADGYVNFTRYGLELQDSCPEGTDTVYRREELGHNGQGRRWRYCQRFTPIGTDGNVRPSWRVYDHNDREHYQVRIVDGKSVVGRIVTTRAPRRAKPRFLEYIVNGDTHRIWW